MKNILGLLVLLTSCLFSRAQVYQEYLLSDWAFKAESDKYWLPAQVPGILIDDLLDNGKSSVNSSDSIWFYRTTFITDKQIMSRDFVELSFEGLDTRATVFLNQKPILAANNMFRSWSVPIKSLIKEGENELMIRFANVEYSPSLRKAYYHFKDADPILPLGVWKPVILESWNEYRLDHLSYRIAEITDKEARLTAELDFRTQGEQQVNVEVYDEVSGRTFTRETVRVAPGSEQIELPFVIKKPKLWWPKKLGKPNLYKIGVRVNSGKNEQVMMKRIGIRDVKVDPSSTVQDFRLMVNGKSVHVDLSEYWPMAMNASSISTDEYDSFFFILERLEKNVLHVASPGIYESPYFYDLADTHGILILQDFMFQPANYPKTASFLENIKAEAAENIKALQHHPSIVAWGGVVPKYPDKERAHSGTEENSNAKAHSEHINALLKKTLEEIDPTYFFLAK